ncbi:MAG: 16S rRNA (uracil(1498)-N(3))-methyltransferase [Calditrichaeota bacterium]|nr:MAG: 16S rRNA (uracil(1498)-N(3))-methyltransferase [Calditrichota bacterium]
MAFIYYSEKIMMSEPIFYANPASINSTHIQLNKTESHHAVKVLRLPVGAIVIAIDGNGVGYRCEISKISRDKLVELKIHSVVRNFGETSALVTLAAGLSAGSKFDEIIEKCTELGVKRFVPLLTEKGKVKIEDPKRIKSKLTRYNKVALAAVKQSRRSYIPEITAPTNFHDFISEIDSESDYLCFHPSQQAKLIHGIKLNEPVKRLTIIIGPESGFSENEINLVIKQKIPTISLGKRILRAENAAPVICGIIMNLLAEFR